MSISPLLVGPLGFELVETVHQDTYPFIDPSVGEASNLTVLVTGASKGIGLATVKSFAAAGASAIALVARSNLDAVASEVLQAAKQAGRDEPQILKLQVDICDSEAVERAIQSVARKFETLDVLINNASRLETWHPLAETHIDDWWATWELNVKGTFLVTRAALPLVLRGRQKTILTVSSGGALISVPGGSAYNMTKSSQIRLSDFLMAKYEDQGLVAFTIHPSSVVTETALNMPESIHDILNDTAELAADTIVWLTRTRKEWLAGRFIWGPVDMQELSAKKDEIVERDLLKLKLAI